MPKHLKLALALLTVTTVAYADRARPDYRADGSVKLGTKTFSTRTAYYRSPEFRESGLRCGAEHRQSNAALISPNDCTLSSTTINTDYDDDRVFVIPVVFHVIKKTDGTGDITPALLKSQVDILNEDFSAIAGTNGGMGTKSRFQFVLATKDPAGNPTPGYEVVTNNVYFMDNGGTGPNLMKRNLKWDPTKYLNLYTNDAGGYLGYATFPQEEAGGPEDGVVLLWNSVGRNAPGGAPYDLGRTATHEIGHYLGLIHTFGDADQCGRADAPYASGDLLSDTPAESEPYFGGPTCTARRSSCANNPGNDPIENYMDYSEDHCMTKFTPEQVNRMRCSFVNYRTVNNTAPKAAFTFANTALDVTFTNTSTDLETPTTLTYKWTFGDGQTSTDANPTHTYAADGTYNVTLVVTDPGAGNDTSTQMVELVTALPDAGVPDGSSGTPDGGSGSNGNDAGTNPGTGDGGGCCNTQGGGATFAVLAAPVALVLRRRRRRGA